MLPNLERDLRKGLQCKGVPGAPENTSPKTPPPNFAYKGLPRLWGSIVGIDSVRPNGHDFS